MRKPDPERIFQARRAALFHRLADQQHLGELDAEHWVSRWEREAAVQGLERFSRDYWQARDRWIAEHLGHGRDHTAAMNPR